MERLSMSDKKEIEKQIETFCSSIMEHADSVRVFVTSHDGMADVSHAFSIGKGNFFAQVGQVKEWIVRQDQYIKIDACKESGDV